MNNIALPILAIVIPCYNEELVILETADKINNILKDLINREEINPNSFIYFVNDGSNDKTWNLIRILNKNNKQFKGLNLSRNFGQQNALLAGLMITKDKADCIISMDADLQDNIDTIYEFIKKYQEGYEIVYGVRNKRNFDTNLKKWSASIFYKFQTLLNIDIVRNHADFRLMSARVLSVLSQFNEKELYLRGIIPLLGFKSTKIYYDREKRIAGESKYPLLKLISLALNGITSFSVFPLRLITFSGFFITAVSIILSIYFMFYALLIGKTVPALASTVLPIYFIGGIQLLSLGLIGEYVGRIYKEVKNRPRYIVDEEIF